MKVDITQKICAVVVFVCHVRFIHAGANTMSNYKTHPSIRVWWNKTSERYERISRYPISVSRRSNRTDKMYKIRRFSKLEVVMTANFTNSRGRSRSVTPTSWTARLVAVVVILASTAFVLLHFKNILQASPKLDFSFRSFWLLCVRCLLHAAAVCQHRKRILFITRCFRKRPEKWVHNLFHDSRKFKEHQRAKSHSCEDVGPVVGGGV